MTVTQSPQPRGVSASELMRRALDCDALSQRGPAEDRAFWRSQANAWDAGARAIWRRDELAALLTRVLPEIERRRWSATAAQCWLEDARAALAKLEREPAQGGAT